MTREIIFARVKSALLEILADTGIEADDIQPETSLVQDLQIESLRFVDLTVSLESRLSIREFPMQDWLDQQLSLHEQGFRVSALVDTCVALTC